jgi:hypothetical protein
VGTFTSSRLAQKIDTIRTKINNLIDDYRACYNENLTFDDLDSKLNESPVNELEKSITFWKLIEQAYMLRPALELTVNYSYNYNDNYNPDGNNSFNYNQLKLARIYELDQVKFAKQKLFVEESKNLLIYWKSIFKSVINQVNSVDSSFKKTRNN